MENNPLETKQEYSIGVDKSVTVNWNETAELKIENEKKKGKIKDWIWMSMYSWSVWMKTGSQL